MSYNIAQVQKRYTSALEHYLRDPDEMSLLRGYEVGRSALLDGLGVIDMATVHANALASVLRRVADDEKRGRVLESHGNFFVEALSPFEMAHRAFREANNVLRRLNDTLEAQAKRIAYALHDEAGQLLASVHFAIAQTTTTVPDSAKELSKVQELLNEIEERLRSISHELRPPVLEEIGLVRALELVAESVSKRWGLPVTITASVMGEMHPTVETAVYRVAQEALTNAARHEDATRAEVDVRQTAQKIVCSVRDNGIGLLESSRSRRKRGPGMGLHEIKERVGALGGVLHIRDNPNRGTDLTVEIPLED